MHTIQPPSKSTNQSESMHVEEIANKSPVCTLERGNPANIVALQVTHKGYNVIWSHCNNLHVRSLIVDDDKRTQFDSTTGGFLLAGHKHPITAVSSHPSSALVATGDRSGTVIVWDLSKSLSSDALVSQQQVLSGAVLDICWSVTGSKEHLVVCGEGRSQFLQVVDPENGSINALVREDSFSGPTKPCSAICSGLENALVVGCDDFGVYLYRDIPYRHWTSLRMHSRRVSSVSCSPNAQLLATTSTDGALLVSRIGSDGSVQEAVVQGALSCSISAVRWLSDHQLVTISTDGFLRKWVLSSTSLADGKDVLVLKDHDDPSSSINQSPHTPADTDRLMVSETQLLSMDMKGQHLAAVVDLHGSVYICNLEKLVVTASYHGLTRPAIAVIHADAKIQAMASAEGRVVMLSRDLEASNSAVIVTDLDIADMRLSVSDSTTCSDAQTTDRSMDKATARLQGLVLDTRQGQGVNQLTATTLTKYSHIFSTPSSGSMGLTNERSLVHLSTGTVFENAVLKNQQDIVAACMHGQQLYVAIAPKRLLVLSSDGSVSKDICVEAVPLGGNLTCMAVSADHVALGDDKRRVHLFQINPDVTPVSTKWCFHNAKVTALMWLSSKILVSGGADNAIMMWSIEDLVEPVQQMHHAHHGSIVKLFEVDGSTDEFASSAQDSVVKQWKVSYSDESL